MLAGCAFVGGDAFSIFCLGWARLGHYIRIRKEHTTTRRACLTTKES